MNGSTTPARNSERRSIVKCGSPIACASRPCLANRRGRAAAALAVVLGVGPQLERDRDRLAARGRQQRRDRAVDAAAHRHQRPARRRAPQQCSLADARTERAVQSVGRKLGGVQLAGAEPAELGCDLLRADPRRLEHRPPARERSRPRCRPRAPRRSRSASKPASATRAPSTASEIETVSQQAPPPATPVKAPVGTRPRPWGELRWCSRRKLSIASQDRADAGRSARA